MARPSMPSMSSIRERNQPLILAAASEEFAANGFDATQTRDIAARAGVPKPVSKGRRLIFAT